MIKQFFAAYYYKLKLSSSQLFLPSSCVYFTSRGMTIWCGALHLLSPFAFEIRQIFTLLSSKEWAIALIAIVYLSLKTGSSNIVMFQSLDTIFCVFEESFLRPLKLELAFARQLSLIHNYYLQMCNSVRVVPFTIKELCLSWR